MKPRKTKSGEPSLRSKLSAALLENFAADFAENGKTVIEALRQESPAKYAEIASRLIAATEPPSKAEGFEADTSMQAIGARLLQSIGVIEPTEDMIAKAIEANDKFIAQLEAIKDRAEFLEGGGELN